MDNELLRCLYRRHRELGYSKRFSLMLALRCIDGSPAPGWTHKEPQ